MGLKMNKSALSLFLLLAFTATAKSDVFDITKFGAKPGGDAAPALTSAWKEACAAPAASSLVVPKGIFPVSRVTFAGPCKSHITFQLQGTLQAPTSAAGFKENDGWITFMHIEGLTLTGGGTFDGQGKQTYLKNCDRQNYCAKLPINVRFDFIKNALIDGITSLDSKQFHIIIISNENVTFQHVNIKAPGDSPNTDGFHIARSTQVKILDAKIETGDDCVSIGDGSRQILVERVTCGPGHGISVGSLGKYQNEQPVVGVTVRNCIFKNTENGVRIKSWPGADATKGEASDLNFEALTMQNVRQGVTIVQNYCPWNQCNQQVPSKVQLSGITFSDIKGTTTLNNPLKLVCSSAHPCKNVKLQNINLQYNGKDGAPISQCKNVNPIITGSVFPKPCTTTEDPLEVKS